jgi:hypothetical protein
LRLTANSRNSSSPTIVRPRSIWAAPGIKERVTVRIRNGADYSKSPGEYKEETGSRIRVEGRSSGRGAATVPSSTLNTRPLAQSASEGYFCYSMESKKIGLFRNAKDALTFKAGQTIFKEGDHADVMYVIQSGEVEVRYNGHQIETLGEGNIFGEMSLISDEPRAATVSALTDARIVPIDLKRFMFLVEETPYFAVQVMRIMSSRIKKMLAKIEPAKQS